MLSKHVSSKLEIMQYEYFTEDENEEDDNFDFDFATREQFSYQTLANGEIMNLPASPSSPSSSSTTPFSYLYQYYQHIILPSDTLQGICLQYRVSPVILRQINTFSSSSLLLAPKKLKIPKRHDIIVREQNKESEEYKVHFIKAEFPILNEKEVRAYLELSGWILSKALDELGDDLSWEKVANTKENSFAVISSIREKMKVVKALKTSKSMQQKKQVHVKSQRYDRQPLLVVGLPLGFNSVKTDINKSIRYDAHAHLHSEFGIELKDLSNPCSTRTYCI